MAVQNRSELRSFKAGADLSAKQFYLVKMGSTAGEVVLAAAATDEVIGILQNAPVAGDTALVLLVNGQGTAKVVAGGVWALGNRLGADSNGKVVALSQTGAGSQPTQRSIGIANSVTADGNVGEVILLPQLY